MSVDSGLLFRQAWIDGVHRHYPSEPKAGYVAPWEEMPQWERDSAAEVQAQIEAFIRATAGAAARLSRAQKGRFVALCWLGQIYRYFPDPKPSYVADWEDLPDWQRETDADIFEAIEHAA